MAKIGNVKEDTGPRHFRPAESEAVEAVPDLGGSARGAELPPAGLPSPPYYLAVHPTRWVVIAGHVVPFARRVSLSTGVGGVDHDRNGRPKASLAVAELEEQGWTIIPWDVDGPGTSYLRRVRSTGGWISRWETLHPGTEDITSDQAGYAAWFQRLIAQGRISGPAPWVLDQIAGKLVATLETERHQRPNSSRGDELDRQLKAVIAARRKVMAAAPPSRSEEETPDVGV